MPEGKSFLDGPDLKDLECLIFWEAGTVGEANERALIAKLVKLMKEHGFGRVPQLCNQIEDIWRHSERVKHYQEAKDDHLKLMASMAAELAKDSDEE